MAGTALEAREIRKACRSHLVLGVAGLAVNLSKVDPGSFLTQVAAGRRLIRRRDAIDLADPHPPAEGEHLGRKGLGIDRDGGIGVRPERPDAPGEFASAPLKCLASLLDESYVGGA